MSAKNKFLLVTLHFFLLLITFLLFMLLFLATSCTRYEQNKLNQDIAPQLNNTADNNIIITLDTNKTITLDQNASGLQQEQEKEQAPEELSEQTQEQTQALTTPRVSEVDFYFLLKGKAYFRATLKEQESKTYNVSGYLVTISPVFISSDRAKFQINNYTTKALSEEEWDSTSEFEILLKNIYYRR